MRPWGVDVSTGVENGPGRKDALKVREFVRNAKAAAPRRYRATRKSGRSTGRRTTIERRHGRPHTRGPVRPVRGRFVPETLIPACAELERAFRSAWGDPGSARKLDDLLRDYAGRPSPLTDCRRLSADLGLRLLLKREDLNHTGSHKINNVLGQALLAQRMGKTRLVAETAPASTVSPPPPPPALMGMECVVYMGEVDMARQELKRVPHAAARSGGACRSIRKPNVEGCDQRGAARLVATVESTHYCLGSVMGHTRIHGWCASCNA